MCSDREDPYQLDYNNQVIQYEHQLTVDKSLLMMNHLIVELCPYMVQ